MPMQRRGRYHASAKERTMLLRCESLEPPMSQLGLGCAKTLAVAPHVEISPGNCIPESQIILHTRGSMPCWRIVFSTFCGCMSFYTGSVIVGHSGCQLNVRFTRKPTCQRNHNHSNRAEYFDEFRRHLANSFNAR